MLGPSSSSQSHCHIPHPHLHSETQERELFWWGWDMSTGGTSCCKLSRVCCGSEPTLGGSVLSETRQQQRGALTVDLSCRCWCHRCPLARTHRVSLGGTLGPGCPSEPQPKTLISFLLRTVSLGGSASFVSKKFHTKFWILWSGSLLCYSKVKNKFVVIFFLIIVHVGSPSQWWNSRSSRGLNHSSFHCGDHVSSRDKWQTGILLSKLLPKARKSQLLDKITNLFLNINSFSALANSNRCPSLTLP